jgi:hypothetical protein
LLDSFVLLCVAHGLPAPDTEVVFADGRKWRLDYGWKAQRVAVEQEGGVWTGGRHTRGVGFEKDCEKYAEAALLGWVVFRASPRQMTNGTALSWVKRALKWPGK